MNYELRKFEAEFKASLQPDQAERNLQKDKRTDHWVFDEQERVCAVFKEVVPGKDQALVKSYFFHHQQSVVLLLDRIFKEIQKSSQDNDHQQTPGLRKLRQMQHGLVNILRFMKTEVKFYFNLGGEVPECYIDSHTKKHQSDHRHVQQSLEERDTASSLISHVISLLKFGNSRTKITFSQFDWVTRMQDDLLVYLESKEEDENSQRLLNLLINLNLNSAEFYLYCCDTLRKALDSELTVADQYKRLASLKKRLNQLPKLEVAGYLPGQASIKVSLLKFLKAEIKALNELEFIAQDLVNAGVLTSNFKVSLSAKQLAFYVYLNVECGIIITEKPKKLHEFIIDHVDSAQKHGLSLKSFKNNYYSHAPADVKKVEERLASMLALIREKFWMTGFTILTLMNLSVHR
jgi:gamma-glutamylcyclotransferase (GGCT)/AIG2-like uncharacterized protein YtfP